jgi:hypothetical protein
MARKLYLDVDTGRFVAGLNGGVPPNLSAFEGDNADYELYFLTAGTGSSAYEPLDYSSKSVKLHIGPQPPSTATAYVAAQAWSNLPITVSATLVRTITGGTAANEQQVLSFSPDAYDGTFALTFPSQALTFSSVTGGLFTTSGSHGLAAGQAFVVTGFGTPTGFSNGSTLYTAQLVSGSQFFANTTATTTAITSYTATTAGTGYTLTATTSVIEARASTTAVEDALEAISPIGTGNVRVTGIAGRTYRMAFTGAKSQVALPLMTVTQALTPVYGKTATLNFNTTELINAISASASIEATMEVEVSQSGKIETVTQAPVTLGNDIIATTGGVPVTVSPAAFFYLQSPDNSTWSISVANDGSLTAAKL